jgi:Polysaccharide biosynthesis/export protein
MVTTTRQTVAVLAVLALPLTACDGPPGALGGLPAQPAMAQSTAYVLSPGDKIKITVFSEPDLTGEFEINDAGMIAYPLIGTIQAAGLSVTGFQDQLVRRLRGGYVRNPRVAIEIARYRPFNVFTQHAMRTITTSDGLLRDVAIGMMRPVSLRTVRPSNG